MANPRKVWGQTRIKVDGRTYETEGKSSLEVGGTTRESVEADFVAGHFTEKTSASKLTCSILLTADVSLTELQAIDNATTTMETDTGRTYVQRNAWVGNQISASEGKAQVEFYAAPAEELSA